jgi:hypothetical protein
MHDTTIHKSTQNLTICQELIYYSWIKMKKQASSQNSMYTYNQEREDIIFWYLCTTNEQHILRYVTINPYKVVQ